MSLFRRIMSALVVEIVVVPALILAFGLLYYMELPAIEIVMVLALTGVVLAVIRTAMSLKLGRTQIEDSDHA